MTAPPRHDGPTGGRRRPPRRGKPQPDAPRRVAFDLLRAVDERDAYANLTLPGLLRDRGVEGRDAAFATELGYGTLRGRGTYDAVLAACVDRPLDQVDPPVLDLLRLGAHQQLAMRVPPHAAVGATVELARAVAGEGRSSFVNAVLRKVGRQDLASWLDEVAPAAGTDPLGHLAVAHSHPRWVVSALRDALGGDLAETAALLAADNEPAQVTLVARPGRSTVADLVADGAEPARWSPYAAVLPAGDPGRLAAVRDGRAGVQDEGSQLVALALAAAPLDGRDEHWLDLCAGPGGKAALLAAVGAERGARLLAAEVAPHRAGLVRRTLGGTGDVVVADGRAARVAGRRVRPGARRRAVHRARSAAATAGGALAAPPEDVPALAAAAARPARRGAGRGAAGRRGRLRHLLAAPRRDRTVVVTPCCEPPASRAARRASAAAGRARPRRRPARAAVAAPARHRRDVPRPAAPRGRSRAVPLARLAAMGVQISPSILSADFADLAGEVARIAPAADWVHVDVMDNHFVPNLTLGLPVVEALAAGQRAPLDCHLMIEDADRWAPATPRPARGSVTFHVEAATAPVGWPASCAGAGARAGMGLQAGDAGRAVRRAAAASSTCCC